MSNPNISAVIGEDYTVNITTGVHELIADEPENLGGKDLGPDPSELILSGLASCKLITMKMYANRKGWDITNTVVHLRYLEKGDPTIVEKRIEFEGDLTEEQRKRLVEISGRCPMVKMLSKSISYEIID